MPLVVSFEPTGKLTYIPFSCMSTPFYIKEDPIKQKFALALYAIAASIQFKFPDPSGIKVDKGISLGLSIKYKADGPYAGSEVKFDLVVDSTGPKLEGTFLTNGKQPFESRNGFTYGLTGFKITIRPTEELKDALLFSPLFRAFKLGKILPKAPLKPIPTSGMKVMKEGIETKGFKGLLEAIGLTFGTGVITLDEAYKNRIKHD